MHRFLRTIQNCHIPGCQGEKVAMTTTVIHQQPFFLSRTEFILDLEVPKDNRD